jgi:hypothetical protein
MNDRAFRLDFFIAIAAVLISALTAATLIYQTRVIGHQFAATIWPYISVSATYGPQSVEIGVSNDGLGPALIRSAQLSVDGRRLNSWNDYLLLLSKEPAIRVLFLSASKAALAGRPTSMSISESSFGASSTLRPGDSKRLIKISLLPQIPLPAYRALLRHIITMDFCYCSLDGTCWTLHSAPGQNDSASPQTVSGCTASSNILSGTSIAPSSIPSAGRGKSSAASPIPRRRP